MKTEYCKLLIYLMAFMSVIFLLLLTACSNQPEVEEVLITCMIHAGKVQARGHGNYDAELTMCMWDRGYKKDIVQEGVWVPMDNIEKQSLDH